MLQPNLQNKRFRFENHSWYGIEERAKRRHRGRPQGRDLTSTKQQARGRPRSTGARTAILKATRELLERHGYARLTTEMIAARSRTSKATIYRWWAGKGEVVLEACHDHINIGMVPDTGDTRQDLLTAANQLIATFSDRLAGIVILAAIATVDNDPKMLETFGNKYVYPWRRSAAEAISRAVASGNLPADTDVQLALDLMVGTVFQRTLVLRQLSNEGLAEAIVTLLGARRN